MKYLFFISLILAIIINGIVIKRVFFVPPPVATPSLQSPIIVGRAMPIAKKDLIQIEEINKKNQEIKNFDSERVEIFTWSMGIRLKFVGLFQYEKEKKLKFQIGKEFLMGSNEQEFWYWSKRDKKPALYYADFKDYDKTMMKPAFNPMMLIESLGLHHINIDNETSVQHLDDKLVVVKQEKDTLGRIIIKMTFLKDKKIIGQTISDQEGKLIASAEILDYQGDVPRQILYTYEQDQAVLINFENVSINQDMSQFDWKKPDMQPAINMTEDDLEASLLIQ